MNDNTQNHGGGMNGGAGSSTGRTPDKSADVVQSILGDLSPEAATLRATIAQRAPQANPQQVEQIASAVQARLGSPALTPEADAIINDVLAALSASGAFRQPAATPQPQNYAPYPAYPQYHNFAAQQYPGAQQYPYAPQPQYPGVQTPYPYQPTPQPPQYPYGAAQPQQGYPTPSSFNYVPQQPPQGWNQTGQPAQPAFPYAQPPQAPPYYPQQGYAQPQQNFQSPAPQPPAPFANDASQPAADWSALTANNTAQPQRQPFAPTPTQTAPNAEPSASRPQPIASQPAQSSARERQAATTAEQRSDTTSSAGASTAPTAPRRAPSEHKTPRESSSTRERRTSKKPNASSETTPSATASTVAAPSAEEKARETARSTLREDPRVARAAKAQGNGAKPTASTPTREKSNAHAEPQPSRASTPRPTRSERPATRLRTEAPSCDLAALAVAAASVARASNSCDLSTLSANSGAATINLNGLRSSSAGAVSTDAFLQLLGRRAPMQQVSASTLDLLNDQSTLDKAKEDAPMWLMSIALHIAIALLLALLVWKTPIKNAFEVVSEPGFRDEVVLDEVFDPDASFEMNEEVQIDPSDAPEVDTTVQADIADVSVFEDVAAAPLAITETEIGLEAPLGEVDNLLGSLMGNELSGRGESKAAALASGGGSEGSEKSVALALAWLAEHQLPNGSWSYDLRYCPTCRGACGNSGTNTSTIAATAMGILPFLAAGHTPTQGKYKKVVANGINYLLEQGVEDKDCGYLSFRDVPGNMYSHGLATITLCETYAMLSDREKARYRKLGYMAQSAVHYIEWAQADDGGWRYQPKQAGDTSVFGWQMMALKSASLGGLEVDDYVVRGARNFLRNIVSLDDETRYAYQRGGSISNATTTIGLLCRLYLDWRTDNPKLLRGAAGISGIGPQFGNPYYNYYAAQLMHNVGGAMWQKWNQQTRDAMCAQQIMEGHERGSWFPTGPDGHCVTGGRLYATSLNCMVLEVYYRHMPLYQRMEAGTQFPIEVLGGESSGAASEPAEEAAEDIGDLDDSADGAAEESTEGEGKPEASAHVEGDQADAPKSEPEKAQEGKPEEVEAE